MRIRDCIRFCRHKPFEALLVLSLVGVMVAYGGSKPTEKGKIKITKANVDAQALRLTWVVEDERIPVGETTFIIEAREKPIMLGKTVVFRPKNGDWYEIGRTKDLEIAAPGFWADKTREIRIRTVVEVGE